MGSKPVSSWGGLLGSTVPLKSLYSASWEPQWPQG